MASLRRPETLVKKVEQILNLHKGDIGLAYVVSNDDTLIPEYPAAIAISGPVATAVHGTHYYIRVFSVEIFILHAKLTVSRSDRTIEDLELVTKAIAHLEEDKTLGYDNVQFAFVDSEAPGSLGMGKANTVVGTRLTFSVEARVAFK